MALTLAAFWVEVVFAVAEDFAAEDAEEEGAAEAGFLLRVVEAETTVFVAITTAEVLMAKAAAEALEDVLTIVGAAEAGLGGGLIEDAALEETFEGALDSTFEGALEGAFAAEALFVTVFEEVPLTFIFVSTTTISLPFAAASSPITFTPSRGAGAGLAGTATQGVTKTGMASKTGIGGGGGGVTG